MSTKVCKKCGEEKLLNRYDWSNKKLGYKKSYCRECSITINYEWKFNKPTLWREWFDKYYAANPEKYGVTGEPKGRKPMNDLKSGVYLITNTQTGETYVGCSSDVKRRIWRHLEYNRGRSKQKGISKAIKQYGREVFTSKVLEYCPKDVMFEREAEWMKKYKCEYNRNKADGTK